MAILKDGVNGGFTGKVGSVIGYQLNGKWVIRGLPKASKKNKVGTIGQKLCRSKFAVIQQFLSVMVPYVRIGFNLESKIKNLSAHNAAKSYNLLHAFTENGALDYTKVVLTKGNLAGAETPVVQVADNKLLFSWVFPGIANNMHGDDQVMLLAYHADSQEVVCLYSGARRKSGAEMLELANTTGRTYHTWISFIADDRMAISTSQYLGVYKV